MPRSSFPQSDHGAHTERFGGAARSKQEGRHGHRRRPHLDPTDPPLSVFFSCSPASPRGPAVAAAIDASSLLEVDWERVNASSVRCSTLPSYMSEALVTSHLCTRDMKRAATTDLSLPTRSGPPLTFVAPACAVSRYSFSTCSAPLIPQRGALWNRYSRSSPSRRMTLSWRPF